jgi:hypothetical protein
MPNQPKAHSQLCSVRLSQEDSALLIEQQRAQQLPSIAATLRVLVRGQVKSPGEITRRDVQAWWDAQFAGKAGTVSQQVWHDRMAQVLSNLK